jgi:glucokinase
MMRFAIGIDIGGTKMLAALGDERGNLLAEMACSTHNVHGGEAGVTELVEAVAVKAGLRPQDAAAIGVGAPGPMDLATGTLLNPPNLGWGTVPIRQLILDRFGVPTMLTNDCKAAGYGEFRFGAGRGTQNMVYLGIGTGIGGCVIIGGQVYVGATGNAGEIGHTVIALDGPLCGCGARGCLEALASGSALGRLGQEAAATSGGQLLALVNGDVKAITGAHVAQAAAQGDPVAQGVFNYAIRGLGAGVGNVMNAFGPERVVLGGGVVAKNGSGYVKRVEEATQGFTLRGCGVPVVAAELGERSGVLGALAHAWEQARTHK